MRAFVFALMLATATGVVRWGCSELRTDLEDEDDRDMLLRMQAEAMRAAGSEVLSQELQWEETSKRLQLAGV